MIATGDFLSVGVYNNLMERNEVGNRYGRLVALRKVPARDRSGAWYQCRCDCGEITYVSTNKLRNGHTKSCGCLKRERGIAGPNLSHGMSKTRTYKTWKLMRARCNTPSDSHYRWYGARGIAVCPRWESFENFLSDMGERPQGQTLDRIDPDGDYEPSNCRWATTKEQAETNRGCFRKGSVPWNKGKGIPKDSIAKIKRLCARGMMYREAAAVVGVSAATAYKYGKVQDKH